MNHKNKTTFITREAALKNRKYYLLDATGKTLGRFASEIAKILCGKHKPDYTPNVDTGDFVIVVNADKITVSGAKEAQKIYRHYTGSVGGLREIPYRTMQAKKPEYIIQHAVRGMVPKGILGRHQLKKLRVFKEENHGMEAQKPIRVNI